MLRLVCRIDDAGFAIAPSLAGTFDLLMKRNLLSTQKRGMIRMWRFAMSAATRLYPQIGRIARAVLPSF